MISLMSTRLLLNQNLTIEFMQWLVKKSFIRIKLIISHIKNYYCNLMESIYLLSFIAILVENHRHQSMTNIAMVGNRTHNFNGDAMYTLLAKVDLNQTMVEIIMI
jgi:hypothetical protein